MRYLEYREGRCSVFGCCMEGMFIPTIILKLKSSDPNEKPVPVEIKLNILSCTEHKKSIEDDMTQYTENWKEMIDNLIRHMKELATVRFDPREATIWWTYKLPIKTLIRGLYTSKGAN